MSSTAGAKVSQRGSITTEPHGQGDHGGRLGFFLCWAVVFADIGTSIYYVPGILYGVAGALAGFFVTQTVAVFLLLGIKYAEVTHRFPQGGGVVTVASQAFGRWFGAVGGMFILVDYFLTAALSSLSAIQYLGVIVPVVTPVLTTLIITIIVLGLLGVLNWLGVKDSARISGVAAVIAFVSDVLILITVFTNVPVSDLVALFPRMFAEGKATPLTLLTGFAGAFLAFSGLESISQLSPVMKTPRRKVAWLAMGLVLVTIGITSPLLTIFSTLLLPQKVVDNPVYSTQLISLLAGNWGAGWLQWEIAASATGLLIFACNTAIIGSYHVFIAMAKLGFFPSALEKKNNWRNTPHNAIAVATGIPIMVLVLALVLSLFTGLDISGVLGDMYAFGLLGAFSLTCLGLDVIRSRLRKKARERKQLLDTLPQENHGLLKEDRGMLSIVNTILYYLGIFTTFIVIVAWSTNLVAKPLATAFGVTVSSIGLGLAFWHLKKKYPRGLPRVSTFDLETEFTHHGGILAFTVNGHDANLAVIDAAIAEGLEKSQDVAVVYVSSKREEPPEFFEIKVPFHNDRRAKALFAYTQGQWELKKKEYEEKLQKEYEERLQKEYEEKEEELAKTSPTDSAAVKRKDIQVHIYYTQVDVVHALVHVWTEANPDLVYFSHAQDGLMSHLTGSSQLSCSIKIPRDKRGTGVRICKAERLVSQEAGKSERKFVPSIFTMWK